MDLVLIKIINNFHVSADQISAVAILFVRVQDGELIKPKKNLESEKNTFYIT